MKLFEKAEPGESIREEFWRWQRFQDVDAAAAALQDCETIYNYERFSLALQGRTPAEKLTALRPVCTHSACA